MESVFFGYPQRNPDLDPLPGFKSPPAGYGEVVSSAEVLVNGQSAGVRVAPARKFDLSGLLRAGENQLEILAFNTLANHY